jgi:hypothetical protein
MAMLILFTGLIGMLNTPTLAETIPITEVFYGDGRQVFEQGIYVIATETNPVEIYPNYTKSDFYKMIKEHVTTETSAGAFTSILISQGICPNSGYGGEINSIEKIDYAFVLSASFTQPGWDCVTLQIITNPIALIPLGNLPVGEYSITLNVDRYMLHCSSWTRVYLGTETWTATFIVVGASFPCPEYIALNATYHALLANYSNLLDDLNSLLADHNALLDDFNSLSADYNDLLDNYDTLIAYFDSLNSSYYGLKSSHESLNSTYYDLLNNYSQPQSDYNSLQEDHNSLSSNYDTMESSYNNLQTDHNSLNSTYNELKSRLDALTADLGTTRISSYVFIIIAILFIGTTAYLAVRRPKVKP